MYTLYGVQNSPEHARRAHYTLATCTPSPEYYTVIAQRSAIAIATLSPPSATASSCSRHTHMRSSKSRYPKPPGCCPGPKDIALGACHKVPTYMINAHGTECRPHSHPQTTHAPDGAPAYCAQSTCHWHAARTWLQALESRRPAPSAITPRRASSQPGRGCRPSFVEMTSLLRTTGRGNRSADCCAARGQGGQAWGRCTSAVDPSPSCKRLQPHF